MGAAVTPLRAAELHFLAVAQSGCCPAAWLASVLRPLDRCRLADLTDAELLLIAAVGPLPATPVGRAPPR